MSRHTHLIAVAGAIEEFGELISLGRESGLRVGWLEWREPGEVDETLARAVDEGAFRALAVGGGRSVAVKRMKGPPVLRDVVREHFKGCVLVLVAGHSESLPLLRRREEEWELQGLDGELRSLSSARLLGLLEKPSIG